MNPALRHRPPRRAPAARRLPGSQQDGLRQTRHARFLRRQRGPRAPAGDMRACITSLFLHVTFSAGVRQFQPRGPLVARRQERCLAMAEVTSSAAENMRHMSCARPPRRRWYVLWSEGDIAPLSERHCAARPMSASRCQRGLSRSLISAFISSISLRWASIIPSASFRREPARAWVRQGRAGSSTGNRYRRTDGSLWSRMRASGLPARA